MRLPGNAPRMRRDVVVRGVVQGVGFRPYVYALARSLGLSGSVRNTSDGVRAEVEGRLPDVLAFTARVGPEAPPLAVVDEVTWTEQPPRGGSGFTIASTSGTTGRTFVSPDVAICPDCLTDLTDPTNRRFRHPFVTCTNCGPRFTVITGLPYDRPGTTMAAFPLCLRCRGEYEDPADRRFHAQTICCPGCGPVLSLDQPQHGATLREEEALARARRLIADGGILAVKGVGGYHLACDATNADAVATLRKRKQRGAKPFALMVRDVAAARRVVALDPAEEDLLTGFAHPIVLARAAGDTTLVAPEVAPGNRELGVMLAYTPLHHLLLGLPGDAAGTQVLVLTSGNLAGEPIVIDDVEARVRLAALADGWLSHDRRIQVPCDDSVVRAVNGVELPVRRSRGYAPMPLRLPFEAPATLAVGADVKNAFCLAEGRLAWLSGHVGDMDDLATLAAFETVEGQLRTITGVIPEYLASDRHPAYRSRRWAIDHSHDRPLVEVQHHHAHVASTMAEHGLSGDEQVLGIAFDGTGYGDDGAAWGGEFLAATYASYTRLAHLSYVDLPGGDAGVRNPCRMALSHLRAAGLHWDEHLPAVRACSDDELRLLDQQLLRRTACTPTSSMGRLFDAVASLAGVCHRAEYDAQAAMELEARTEPVDATGYAFAVLDNEDGTWSLDPAPLIAELVGDVMAGEPTGLVATRFHRAVADLTVEVALRQVSTSGLTRVTLSGGVFLNAFLTSACERALASHGFEVLRHRKVPPSDAGISLGQVAVLAHSTTLTDRRPTPPEQESACA